MVFISFLGQFLAIIGTTDPCRKCYEASKYKYSPFKLYGMSWPSVEVIIHTYNFTYLPFIMY
jgi:hypothetical protein